MCPEEWRVRRVEYFGERRDTRGNVVRLDGCEPRLVVSGADCPSIQRPHY
jgi:hypothetical protein